MPAASESFYPLIRSSDFILMMVFERIEVVYGGMRVENRKSSLKELPPGAFPDRLTVFGIHNQIYPSPGNSFDASTRPLLSPWWMNQMDEGQGNLPPMSQRASEQPPRFLRITENQPEDPAVLRQIVTQLACLISRPIPPTPQLNQHLFAAQASEGNKALVPVGDDESSRKTDHGNGRKVLASPHRLAVGRDPLKTRAVRKKIDDRRNGQEQRRRIPQAVWRWIPSHQEPGTYRAYRSPKGERFRPSRGSPLRGKIACRERSADQKVLYRFTRTNSFIPQSSTAYFRQAPLSNFPLEDVSLALIGIER